MKEYTLNFRSALKKMSFRNNNEVSNKLTPKEKQALTITYIVTMTPVVIILVFLGLFS